MRVLDEGEAFGPLKFVHFCLENRLEVLLVQNPPAAVVACHLQYRVGSCA